MKIFLQSLRSEFERHFAYSYTRSRLRFEKAHIRTFLEHHPSTQDLKFSLVVPLWGIAAHYVRELFHSIERQSYRHWEVCICVDGDESPSLLKLLAKYQKRWKQRLRITHHNGNQGISRATRSALDLVTGDIIAFVDGDDLLHSKALECFAGSFAQAPDVDFVYSDMDFITDWGWRHDPVRKPAWSPHLLITVMYISHLKCIRTSLLQRCEGIFESRYDGSQDWHFCLQATTQARRICHIPLILYHWRKRPGSMAFHSSCKPWAFHAAHSLQADHFRKLDENFAMACHPILGTPPGPVPQKRKRPLVLIQVSTSDFPYFRYIPEPKQFSRIIQLSLHFIKDWDVPLKELTDDSLLLFQCEDSEPFYGDLSAMEAFCVMADVGASWPVFAFGSRYGYTIAEPGSGWKALGQDTSKFNMHPKNIMTGPLHGLLIEWRKMRKIGGFTRLSELLQTSYPQEIGVQIGVECLRHGLRNTSITAVFCRQTLPPLPTSHLFSMDPYQIA